MSLGAIFASVVALAGTIFGVSFCLSLELR